MALAALHYRQLVFAKDDGARKDADAALQADLSRLRALARPVYPKSTELKYLGRTWWVGQPEAVWRDSLYVWAYQMDQLRRGENPRPITPGHGLADIPRVPSTQPARRSM
ncbi:MAG: hypothetical protein QM770_14205 [Tepidisphaeraceae bacterium]